MHWWECQIENTCTSLSHICTQVCLICKALFSFHSYKILVKVTPSTSSWARLLYYRSWQTNLISNQIWWDDLLLSSQRKLVSFSFLLTLTAVMMVVLSSVSMFISLGEVNVPEVVRRWRMIPNSHNYILLLAQIIRQVITYNTKINWYKYLFMLV